MLSSFKTFFGVTLFVWLVGGLATWCVGIANSSIVGCGLLCFGWFGYPERGGERGEEEERKRREEGRGEERRGERRVVTLFVWVIGGLATWCVGTANSSIIGCGLLCFGWFGYPEREEERGEERRGERKRKEEAVRVGHWVRREG